MTVHIVFSLLRDFDVHYWSKRSTFLVAWPIWFLYLVGGWRLSIWNTKRINDEVKTGGLFQATQFIKPNSEKPEDDPEQPIDVISQQFPIKLVIWLLEGKNPEKHDFNQRASIRRLKFKIVSRSYRSYAGSFHMKTWSFASNCLRVFRISC